MCRRQRAKGVLKDPGWPNRNCCQNYFKADKLKITFDEKMKAPLSARYEVLMFKYFFSGVPDRNISVSQQALESK